MKGNAGDAPKIVNAASMKGGATCFDDLDWNGEVVGGTIDRKLDASLFVSWSCGGQD